MRANLNPSRFGRVSTDLPQAHKNLMRAVFFRAAVDAIAAPFVTNTRPDASKKLAQNNLTCNNRRRMTHVQAREWLLDSRPDAAWPFTSETICQVWGYNANAIRTKVREGKPEQWNTLLTKLRAVMS